MISGETISLDRFSNEEGTHTEKDSSQDEDEKKEDSNGNTKHGPYRLRGVVRHIGNTALSGHYTADAVRKNKNGDDQEWVNFDDSTMSMTSVGHILKNERCQQNNYMMLYATEK